MKIIAVINQKGGVAKTTTASILAYGLKQQGLKVLVLDMDPQCNLGFWYGVGGGPSMLGVLLNEIKIDEAIQTTSGGDIIPSHKALYNADALIEGVGKEYRLKEALAPLEGKYDYVIIDTPPTLATLTVNALTAADRVIIPALADIFSLTGIKALHDTIQTIKKYCNPTLQVEGILLTKYSGRSIVSRYLMENAQKLAAQMNTKVFNATIREAVAVREAQALQVPLLEYAPKAKVTEDYKQFIQEVLTYGSK